MRPPTASTNQDGFTLVELLVGIIITSLVVPVIAACIIVGLKTSDATANRLAESHDAQLLSTYLVADVQSTTDSSFITTDVPTGCGAAGDEASYTTSKNLLLMAWTQTLPAPASNYRVSYRLAKNAATSQWQLLRYACTNGGVATDIIVASQLADPAITPPVVDVSHQPAMSLTLTEPSGYSYTVSAVRRTPSSTTLPVVPWACTVQSALATPDPALRTSATPGPLASDLSIEVQSGGDCPSLTLTVTPGGSPDYDRTLAETPAGSGRWVTVVSGATGTWTDGDKGFPIKQGATVIGTLRLTVKQPCLVTAFTASPSPASRAPGRAPGALASDESINVTTTGPCLPLLVDASYDPAQPAASLSLTENPVGSGSWTGSIAAASLNWTDGAHSLVVHEPGGTNLAATTLVTRPNCVVTTSSVTPNPATLDNGSAKNHLLTDVALSLSTSGSCTSLSVTFKPDDVTNVAVAASGGPSAWTATLSKDAYAWTAGTKTLVVRDVDGDIVTSLTLQVS